MVSEILSEAVVAGTVNLFSALRILVVCSNSSQEDITTISKEVVHSLSSDPQMSVENVDLCLSFVVKYQLVVDFGPLKLSLRNISKSILFNEITLKQILYNLQSANTLEAAFTEIVKLDASQLSLILQSSNVVFESVTQVLKKTKEDDYNQIKLCINIIKSLLNKA